MKISKLNKTTATLVLMSLLVLAAAGCKSVRQNPAEQKAAVTVDFNADSAYNYCAAQCSFGPRTMNSEAHELCGQWIQRKFEQAGCQVHLQKADLRGYDGTVLKSTNILAATPSDGKAQRILICAHWDSRPWADNDPDEKNWHTPVMGANDGASGVAVMLELARLLAQHDSAAVAVDFLCLDAEDWGVPQWADGADSDSWALGAQHFAENFKDSKLNYQYAILLDMVGGQGARFYREGYSKRYASRVMETVWRAASAAGYGSFFVNQDGGWVTDDHVPLCEKAGIPCIDIINHYPDCEASTFGPVWHTVSDDMQHIDRNTLKAVGQTLVQLIFEK